MNQQMRRRYLIEELLKEQEKGGADIRGIEIPEDAKEQEILLRGLFNIRMPAKASPEFLSVQDAYLHTELLKKGIVDATSLPEVRKGIALWQGDITRLKCDAIVNAANSGMTGCYVPNHRCIDNCIHTYAGVQLRCECARLMRIQGREEKTGKAKITSAYNLPARYVIHTVGPVVQGGPTRRDRELLSSCYHSCLELASARNLTSIAFCCISTGEFHFPNKEAAEIAIHSVLEYLAKESSVKKVIFNVFKDSDREIYEELLGSTARA